MVVDAQNIEECQQVGEKIGWRKNLKKKNVNQLFSTSLLIVLHAFLMVLIVWGVLELFF